MLDNSYFKNGHLTLAAFLMLESGKLSVEERELLLSHLDNCDQCMDTYLESLSDDMLTEPPDGLEENIIRAVHEEYTAKKESKILVLQFTKLGIAVCITMVLFMSGVFGLIGKTSKDVVLNEPVRIEQQFKDKKVRENHLLDLSKSFNKGFNQFADKLQSSFNFGGVESNATK